MTASDLARLVLSGVAGAAIGWAAQALTISGRVEALERGQHRIESLLLDLVTEKRADAPPAARPR